MFLQWNPDINFTNLCNTINKGRNDFPYRLAIKADSVAAVEKYCGGDYAKYKKEVSDHVPVSLTINLK